MKRFDYLALFIAQLSVLLIIASAQTVPGYMDADYYYAGGLNLAGGRGLHDEFLWNYLDDPDGLPHPSHTYWMPLPSIIAALGMLLTGRVDYLSARLVFFVLACLIPPLSAWIGFYLTRERVAGWVAGGLAIFSCFYMAYMGLVETFTLTMLLASIFILTAVSTLNYWLRFLCLGLLAGLMHLTRADGLLWLFFGFIVIGIELKSITPRKPGRIIIWLGVICLGYLVIMGFWYARNIVEFGSLLPPGNSRAFWLLDYDQLFSFPAKSLNFESWISAGAGVFAQQRFDSLITNLKSVLAVQGEIFLLPLALIGGWRLRKNKIIRVGFAVWGTFFLLMTLVFPLAGSRGGFFHSGAATQPIIWGLTPVGLMWLIEIGIRKRGWKMERALPGFGFLLVVIAAVMSVGITWTRIVGEDIRNPTWSQSWNSYRMVDAALNNLNAKDEDIVMVNNPPGYFIATGRQAIVIPNGDETETLAVARTFNADYLILEANTVKGLSFLYNSPEDRPSLKYLESIQSILIFKILR